MARQLRTHGQSDISAKSADDKGKERIAVDNQFDGTKHNVELSISLIDSPQAERSIFCDLNREFSDRKESEEGLQGAHSKLEIKVNKRGDVFGKPNKRLRQEIKDRKLAQEESVARRVSVGKRVLFMDDDELIRELALQVLSLLGYEVVLARDGQEAVGLYMHAKGSSEAFDAVIMDLTVPGGLGGKEAVQLLHEADPNVRGIVSSGYSKDPVMDDFREYGFSGVVRKPYTVAELSRVLKEVLAPGGHEAAA